MLTSGVTEGMNWVQSHRPREKGCRFQNYIKIKNENHYFCFATS